MPEVEPSVFGRVRKGQTEVGFIQTEVGKNLEVIEGMFKKKKKRWLI